MNAPNRENWLAVMAESGRLAGTMLAYGLGVVGDRVLNRVYPLDVEQRAAIEQAAAQANVWKSAGELGLQHIAAHQSAVSESEWLGNEASESFDIGSTDRCWSCGSRFSVRKVYGEGGYVYCCHACSHPSDVSVVSADGVVDAEVHCEGCQCPTICGCGQEIYPEYDIPGQPPLWFHRVDDSPITLECAQARDAETPPGAVSDVPPSPAPGRPTSELLNAAAIRLRLGDVSKPSRTEMDRLIAELRDRARLLASQND